MGHHVEGTTGPHDVGDEMARRLGSSVMRVGVERGYLRSDANGADVRDYQDTLDELAETGRGQSQRVPATQQDVGDAGVGSDVLERGVPIAKGLPVALQEQALAEAVPTVTGALVRDQHQSGVAVLVLKSIDHCVRSLVRCVRCPELEHLRGAGNDQLPDRITGVVPVDERGVVVGRLEGGLAWPIPWRTPSGAVRYGRARQGACSQRKRAGRAAGILVAVAALRGGTLVCARASERSSSS